MYNTDITHLDISSSNNGCSVHFYNSEHTITEVYVPLLKPGYYDANDVKQLKAELLCSLNGVSGVAGEISYRCYYNPHGIESIMLELRRTATPPPHDTFYIKSSLPSIIGAPGFVSKDTDSLTFTYRIPFGKVIY